MSKLVLPIVVAVAFGGCGTISNLRGNCRDPGCPKSYGGVSDDIDWGWDVLTDSSCGHGGLPGCIVQKLIVAPYVLTVDLPLSVVGDTLTLPSTMNAPHEQPEGGMETNAGT